MMIHSRHHGGNRVQQLDRTSLPSPLDYLAALNVFPLSSRKHWVSIRCPSHKAGTERNPSLRINTLDGRFRCMTCGVSGGDILALHRLRTGLGFLDAVHDLGGRFHD